MHKVFVYGTLKQGFRNHALLNGARLLVPEAMVTGLCLRAGPHHPYATPARRTSRIFGEIYVIGDTILERLDILEGHPEHYRREIRTAVHADGRIRVWVYVGNALGSAYPLIASGRYERE